MSKAIDALSAVFCDKGRALDWKSIPHRPEGSGETGDESICESTDEEEFAEVD